MWYNKFSIAGKRVLLTGASGGIGLALAQGFVSAGASVVGTYSSIPHQNFAAMEKTGLFFPVQIDLGQTDDVHQLTQKSEELLNSELDIVIHCAWPTPLGEPYSLGTLRETEKIGLEVAYILYKQNADKMAKRGIGNIISVCSINGISSFPNNPSYTALKAALRLFTKTIARDYGERGVRANNLCPGYTITKRTQTSYNNPILNQERSARTMLGRWATPDEMVEPCIFLASDASRYITGHDLIVDGGWINKGL